MIHRAFRLSLLLSALLTSRALLSAQEAAARAEPPIVQPEFLAEHAATRGYSLGRPTKPTPTPDGTAVLFLRARPDNPAQDLFEFDAATKQTKTLLTADQLMKGGEEKLTPEEKARRERQRLQARGLASFTLFDDGRKLLVPLSGKLFVFDRATGRHEELPLKKTPIDPQVSPDGKKLAYVLDHDVFVMDLATKAEKQLTTGGTADVSHGLAEFVAQEEMNRHHGFWWTADSKRLVYEEADARAVEVWRVADAGNPAAKPSEQRYPRPGKNNVKVRLGVIPADGGETVWIKWDAEKYPYLTTVKADEGGPLTMCVQDRIQQQSEILAVNCETGEANHLFSMQDPAWLNIDQQFPFWLKDSERYLVGLEKDDGCKLMLMHRTQDLPNRPALPAAAKPAELCSFDDRSTALYYLDSAHPLERHLNRIQLDLSEKGPTRLTTAPGVHSAVFSKNHAIYVLTAVGPKSMPKTTVHRADGTLIGELPSVAKEPPFTPTTEYVQVGKEGWWCAVTRPRNFDPKKKYPVIVSVYGGPTLQTVMKSMPGYLMAQWQADQGFIVVHIDNRGTPGRGRSWERAIYRSFGSIPLDDQAAALKALGAKFPELDLTRVGIRGWSFGGYMSALAVLKRPDVYHAGIAGAPVCAWEDYDTHYTERYLGLPKDNPDGYKESSLLTWAPKLSRPLLLVHGTADDNVYPLHSLKLADALTRAGKDFEYLPLLSMTHGVSDATLRRRLEERCLRFFKRHLGAPKEAATTAKAADADIGFRPLFNGKDLEGWVREARDRKDGIPKWSVTSAGDVRCEAGMDGFGFLRYEREEFDDFILRLEYRFEPKELSLFSGNSGVGIRTCRFDPAQSGATRPSFASFEIQLLDDAGKPANKLCTGSLYRYAAPSANRAKPAPEWNDLEIACEGPRIRIRLNGEEVMNVDQAQLEDLPERGRPKSAPAPKDKPTKGFVCLQSHTGTILFRNVRIKPLGRP